MAEVTQEKKHNHSKFSETKVEFKGETKTIAEWSAELDIPINTIYNRRYSGNSWAEALTKQKKVGHAWRKSTARVYAKLYLKPKKKRIPVAEV